MRKIDRLGWAAGISFVSYGVRVGVRVSDPAVMDRVPELLPPGGKPARSPTVKRLYSLRVGGAGTRPGVRRFNMLWADAARLSRTMELDDALHALRSDLQIYVAEKARRRVFVHAGVVRWRGQAIVIPGRSRSGKSTLVRELVRAGATYYSDEYAVLDSRGRVHPYPRPLSLRKEGDVLSKPAPVEAMGGRPGVKPLTVGVVVLTGYREGARWRPRRLSPGRAAIELVNHCVSARRGPQLVLTALRQVASEALIFKGVRGDAREMVESLLDIASDHATGAGMDKRPARVPA